MKKRNDKKVFIQPLSLQKKKGVSAIISYVLLIAITLSLSILVYDYLRRRFDPENKLPECPDGVNVVIYDVRCYTNSDVLSITLKNRGRFIVDGYYLRYSTDEDAEFGIKNLEPTNETEFIPGEERVEIFDDLKDAKNIRLVDVQPYLIKDGKISCKSITSQRVNCKPSE